MKKPSEEKKFMDAYPKEASEIKFPRMKGYDFLLERNKDYMNYTAISFGNKKITYEELHTRIDQYKTAFEKRGFKQGDVIGVCLTNNPESIYTLYALDRIGCVVVGLSPLNNEYKMNRDLEMTKPKSVITANILYDNMKTSIDDLNISPILYNPTQSLGNPIITKVLDYKMKKKGNFAGKENTLKTVLKDAKDYQSINADSEFGYEDITDIMFTGGSSGYHKAVGLNDNRLNCVVRGLDYVLKLEPGQIHLGQIPFGHMAFGRLVMHYALCNNLEFALTLKSFPTDFYSETIRTRSNGIMGGPVHYKDSYPIPVGSLSEVTQALSGGEQFKPDDYKEATEKLRKGGSKAIIGDGLGLTEAWAPVMVNYGGVNTIGTLGYPIPGVNAKVLDPITKEEVPRNQVGELHVSSEGLMVEYINNPEENAKVFSYDENGVKWYNTGDLVKRLDNDEFKYVGRRKRNFVCGVDNIYPEQIEDLILPFEEVNEIVVTKRPDSALQFIPVYNISLTSESVDIPALEERICQRIKETLGESAMPKVFNYSYKPLKRTDNGKLDATNIEKEDLERLKSETLTRKRTL